MGMIERIAQTSTTPTTNRMMRTVRFVSTSQAEATELSVWLRTGAAAGSFVPASVGCLGNAAGSDKSAIENLLALNKTQPNDESALVSNNLIYRP
jgi:hypothetical protein